MQVDDHLLRKRFDKNGSRISSRFCLIDLSNGRCTDSVNQKSICLDAVITAGWQQHANSGYFCSHDYR